MSFIVKIRKVVSNYTVYIKKMHTVVIYRYLCMKGFTNFILLSSPVLYNDELSCNCRKTIMEEAASHPSQQYQ